MTAAASTTATVPAFDPVALRRELHAHAEPAFCEIGTAVRIKRELSRLPVRLILGEDAQDVSHVGAYPDAPARQHWFELAVADGLDATDAAFFRDHGTAIVAELAGDRPGPVWGLRTDIDALPIREAADSVHFPAREGFASGTGAMHACGHDCHAAIGVSLLARLSDHHFPGTLKVVFQPAEEGVRGAQTILDAHATDDVTRMLAIHVRGDLPVGTFVASSVGGMATNKLLVEFTGRASHASGAPEEGRNALLAASAAAFGIMSLPRFGTADTRLNVGTLHGGDNVNIVPARTTMTCEARASDDEVLVELVRRVENMIVHTAAAYEVEETHQITGRACTLRPDDELVDAIAAVADGCPGVESVTRTAPGLGSDDAHLLIRNAQQRGGLGAYLNVGCSSPAPHHNDRFDADERNIAIGVDVLERLLRAEG